ncbi:hypothetical protein MABM_53000 (plasmid) [Mycobacteroides abscessus]|uniref:hypothetical protein n=1 Tax=Mycobacteroides abscessus TaxID=36809 RepID=UPI0003A74362|nr:hypothetical protein [Mycobacteroides abscessus]BBZ85384.1 hypothetical protein MABM_53000 [Mycobacteroides abscessus]
MTDLHNTQREQDSRRRKPITITIDDVEFDTADDDQESASLLRLAGRDPKDFDLFIVDKHGVETHVKDVQIVNLRDGGRFRTRRKVRFTIDGERHISWDDDQTAAALLRLAGVDPTKYDLARVNAVGEPETFSGDQVVTIHDGDEFVTAKHIGGVA